jgi:hypothetical protein
LEFFGRPSLRHVHVGDLSLIPFLGYAEIAVAAAVFFHIRHPSLVKEALFQI